MSRFAFAAVCLCVGVQSEELVSMLQTRTLNVHRTSAQKWDAAFMLVDFEVKTCDRSHSGSRGAFTIQFDGDVAHRFGPFKTGSTEKFEFGVGSSADLRRFEIKALSSDGWCVSSIALNGNNVLVEDTWFDDPCDSVDAKGIHSYKGIACFPSFHYAPAVVTTSVSITTRASTHAGSDGDFHIQFDGDSHKHKLVGLMSSPEKAYTFDVDVDATADLKKFTVIADGDDGLCVTSIVVNGEEAMGEGYMWFDNPCLTGHYGGASCHPAYTFDLTPVPVEVVLPEFDMNEGNACKLGYNYIRTKDDCKNAAKAVKFAGELGVFMAKEREVTNRPSGCYMQTNEKQAVSYRRVIYNTHAAGAVSNKAMIICKLA